MISFLGTILAQDGVSEYTDGTINVYMNSSSKFVPTIGVAQVGKLVAATETQPASFNIVAQVGTYEYTLENPSFEEVQEVVLAGLQADSTSRGLLPPRLTTAQRDAIATPAAGLMIYNTSTNRPNFYDGSAWVAL